MSGWHVSMCLSFLVANGDLLNGFSTEIEGGYESRGTKDIFEDGPVLDYLRRKELAFDVTPKERNKILL